MKPRSLVSIVNWNGTAATNACLAGIAKLPTESQPDVVVADNNSKTDRFKIEPGLRESLNSIEIVHNDRNLGFAGGHNPNIRRAKQEGYDYIFLLNPDTEIIDPKMFQELASALEANPGSLGANPIILRNLDPNIIWYGGGELSLKTSHASHLQVGQSETTPAGTQKVSFVTGCCLAISLKRAELSQLLLSEDYFVYWEDTDWSARATKAGFDLLYIPKAKLLHHVSDTLGVRSPIYIYYNIRNHFLFIRKNIRIIYWPLGWLQIAYITLKYKLNILVRYDRARLKALKGLWWGWMDGISNHRGQLRRKL